MKKLYLLLYACLILTCNLSIAQKEMPNSKSDFFNNPPVSDKEAVLFKPHFISTSMNEFNAVFMPALDELYFSVRFRSNYFVILNCKKLNGMIQEPEIATFSGVYQDADPFITSDGKYLYFCSDRPVDTSDTLRDWNIWRMKRDGKEWVDLELLPFNTPNKSEMYPTLSNNGNVYFHADYESPSETVDFSKTDIYRSKFVNNHYLSPEKINELSSSVSEWDPFISPNEDYLIFSSPRQDSYGSGDMYISFNNNGKWTSPKNMGPIINSQAMDYCASLSPDGKYLFFSSYRSMSSLKEQPTSYVDLQQTVNGPLNGYGDIYWIKATIIDQLR